MTLPELSIRRPVFAWMLMSSLIIFGTISFFRLGVSQLPDVDFPTISISIPLAGASPEVIETQVVDVVENAVMTIEGVKLVTSTAKAGRASVTVEFELKRSMDAAFNDVQTKMAEVQRKLPKEIDAPVISKSNPEDQPIIWITVESDKFSPRYLMQYTRNHIQPHFSTTPDVGDISLGGYLEPNIRVWVLPEKLSKYALTVADVVQAIQNEHIEVPAGLLEEGKKEFSLKLLGESQTIAGLKQLYIHTRGGQPNYSPIRLGEVTRIEEGLEDVRRISRSNGKPAIGLGIRKQRGANAVAVAQQVREKIKKLEKTLPDGFRMNVRFDNTQFIQDSIHELNFTLLLSAILTSLICWLFLGSWSSTLNVILAIPTSILGTFIILYFSGFTLNTFTVLGLSLAIGIVVDDSIMVLENIVRHRGMGKNKVEAATVGANEIYFAAMAATISIVAIFLPVAFLSGVIGKFFFQFGVTLSAAVLLSLVEAITLTPMRCSQFLQSTGHGGFTWMENTMQRLLQFYQRGLGIALARKGLVLMAAFFFFVGSCFLFIPLRKELLPAEDQSRFMIRFQTPIGSAISYTDQKTKLVEDFLATRSEIEGTFVSIGGFGGGDVNTAVAFVTLKPKNMRGQVSDAGLNPSQSQLMSIYRKELSKIPDLKVNVQDLSLRSFSGGHGYPIEFSVQGSDWDTLIHLSKTMQAKLEATGLITDIDTNYRAGLPEIQITPDRTKTALRAVSISQIATTIQTLFAGLVAGNFEEGGHQYDIRVKMDPLFATPDHLSHLLIRNNRGELLPLSEVATIKTTQVLQSISRENRERAIGIYGNMAPKVSQEAVLTKIEALAKELLPDGYHLFFSGSTEGFKDMRKQLLLALALGILVAYMVLASQFNSFLDPITVLLALPFSISGALLGLFVTGQSLNLYSFIGILLLMGIVKKNSILLVDFTNQVREKDRLSITEALLKACPTRFRPIIMTSTATIVGAVPAALAIGPGSESRSPMAVTIIAGVFLSTLLTLFVIPCFYSLIARKSPIE